MRPRPALLLLLAAALACGRDIDPPRPERQTIPPRTFAAVITELSLARAQLMPDTAAYRARRDAILAAHRVSAEQLRTFVEAYGQNEDLMADVYELVSTRLDTTFGSGAIAPPPTGETPPEEPEPTIEPAPAD